MVITDTYVNTIIMNVNHAHHPWASAALHRMTIATAYMLLGSPAIGGVEGGGVSARPAPAI